MLRVGACCAEALPFRDFVVECAAWGCRGRSMSEFFGGLLGDVGEPTAPFGLVDVRGDGRGLERWRLDVPDEVGAAGAGAWLGVWG